MLLELTNVLEGISQLRLHLLRGRLLLGLRTRVCRQASTIEEKFRENPASIVPSLTGRTAVSETGLPAHSLFFFFFWLLEFGLKFGDLSLKAVDLRCDE